MVLTQASTSNERWMDGWMDGCKQTTVHRPPVQSCVAAANSAVLAACMMILAHMVMNRGGNAKQNGCSRHGVMAKAGRQGKTRPL